MAIDRPSLFTDSDMLTFRQTPTSEFRIAYTFVEALNEGTLFDRSARTFEEAARTQRLYDVVVGEDDQVHGNGGELGSEGGSCSYFPSAQRYSC